MASAYFCNTLGHPVRFSINNAPKPDEKPTGLVEIAGRKSGASSTENILPMIGVEIEPVAKASPSVFAQNGSNLLIVEFATGEISKFDLSIDAAHFGQDLFFYIFANTLVGQNQLGVAEGISIEWHRVVRSLIQKGNEIKSAPIDTGSSS